jgi:hypothetical protein
VFREGDAARPLTPKQIPAEICSNRCVSSQLTGGHSDTRVATALHPKARGQWTSLPTSRWIDLDNTEAGHALVDAYERGETSVDDAPDLADAEDLLGQVGHRSHRLRAQQSRALDRVHALAAYGETKWKADFFERSTTTPTAACPSERVRTMRCATSSH